MAAKPSVRTEWQDWNRTGNVTCVTPWALATHTWFYTDLHRSAVCRIPNGSKKNQLIFVQPGFRVTLGFKFNTLSFHHRKRMLMWRDTVSMVSKNKEPGVALQHHRSCVSMPTRVKLGRTLKGGGQRSRIIKGSLLDSKWKWGCFLPWGSFIFPGTGSQKKNTLHAEKLI